MSVLSIIGQVILVLGALVFLSAALGVLRFPDPFTRTSAVGTAGGIGIVFVVVGAFLIHPGLSDGLKVMAITFLQLATSAVGSMMIARSAYITRTPMYGVIYDEVDRIEEDEKLGPNSGEPTS